MRRGPVQARLPCGGDGIAQGRHVAQSEIDALPGQWMHDMRGIAEQQHAAGDVVARQLAAQRECRPFRQHPHVTEPGIEGAGQFGIECGIVQRQHARGLVLGHGPHDRTRAIRARQERQWSARQESLPGGVLVRMRRRHIGDQATLRIVMAIDVEPRQRAQRRFRAIGGDHEARIQVCTVIEPQAHAIAILLGRFNPRRAMHLHAGTGQGSP